MEKHILWLSGHICSLIIPMSPFRYFVKFPLKRYIRTIFGWEMVPGFLSSRLPRAHVLRLLQCLVSFLFHRFMGYDHILIFIWHIQTGSLQFALLMTLKNDTEKFWSLIQLNWREGQFTTNYRYLI